MSNGESSWTLSIGTLVGLIALIISISVSASAVASDMKSIHRQHVALLDEVRALRKEVQDIRKEVDRLTVIECSLHHTRLACAAE